MFGFAPIVPRREAVGKAAVCQAVNRDKGRAFGRPDD